MALIRSTLRYTTGTARVKIYFPEGDVRCIHCRFCRFEQGANRYFCRLDPLGRQVLEPRQCIEGFCPIEFEEESI